MKMVVSAPAKIVALGNTVIATVSLFTEVQPLISVTFKIYWNVPADGETSCGLAMPALER